VERRAGVGAPYNKRNSNFMRKYFHAFVVQPWARQRMNLRERGLPR